MAISMELAELKRIAGRSNDLNTELAGELTNIKNELEAICNNVRSSELTTANENLTNSIISISDRIKANLPEIIAFLNQQITAYEETDNAARTEINNLVASINSNFQ